MHAERIIAQKDVWVQLTLAPGTDDYGIITLGDQYGGICHHHYNPILFYQGTDDPNTLPNLKGMFVEPGKTQGLAFNTGQDYWVKVDTAPVTIVVESA